MLAPETARPRGARPGAGGAVNHHAAKVYHPQPDKQRSRAFWASFLDASSWIGTYCGDAPDLWEFLRELRDRGAARILELEEIDDSLPWPKNCTRIKTPRNWRRTLDRAEAVGGAR